MIDGVAPRAKMNQQRERRYKSMFFRKILTKGGDAVVWDSNKITPGTEFMRKIHDALIKLTCELTNVNFVISGSNECGEGEHKMMQYISSNCKNGSIMIYGLDADLIMLALLSKQRRNIMLLRDNNFNDKLQDVDKTFTYLNIDILQTCICREIKQLANMDLEDNRIVQDYIFICFLLGNDFLERLPSVTIKENGVSVLTKIYTRLLNKQKGYLVDNSRPLHERIDLRFLKEMFSELAKSEDYFFRDVYGVYKTQSVYKDVPIAESYDNMTFCQDDCIKYNKPGYKKRYYSYYGINDVNKVCKDYISGLYWVLGYYNGHEHCNWDWFYKHHATPFVSDLVVYMEKCNSGCKIEPSRASTEREQLLLVLPKTSLLSVLNEVDKEFSERVQRVFRTGSSNDLRVFYPETLCIDMIHREYLWQSKIFFEQFDKDLISMFF
jgi:5'-3' exoribonuclease 2